MPFVVDDLPNAVREAKKKLRAQNPNYAKTFAEVEEEMKRQVAEVIHERESGGEVLPIIKYADVAAGRISDATKDKFRFAQLQLLESRINKIQQALIVHGIL